MARGRIEGNKIIVPFVSGSTTEEIYRVKAVGVSTSEKSPGMSVLSNDAVVVHEKHSEIWLGNPGTAIVDGETWKTFDITGLNIRPGTYNVSKYPSCVSNYFIRGNVLYYQTNVSYGSARDCGVFVVSGFDIYGNIIFSNEVGVDGSSGVEGSLRLYHNGGHVSSTTTRIELGYTIEDGPITGITVYDKSDNIISVEISGNTTSGGHVYLNVPVNYSKYTPNEYRISIKGYNRYGDTVVSNEVTVIQDPKDGNSQFYIIGVRLQYPESTTNIQGNVINENEANIPLGNDSRLYGRRMLRVNKNTHEYGYANSGGDTIERTELAQITGMYDVYFSSSVSDVAITGYSEGISGIDHSSISTSPETVIAFVEENTTPYERELIIYGTGRTQDGTIVYAEGVLIQPPGAYILICGTTAYDGPDVPARTQRVVFNYTSKGVTGITATVNNSSASATVNTNTKTVMVTISQNESAPSKTFKVTLKGRSAVGTEMVATYTFKQLGANLGDFKLVSGDTSTTGYVEYNASSFQLSLKGIPDGTTNIGVYSNTSESGIYKIYRVEIGGGTNERTVTCYVYPNQGNVNVKYKLQISGTTEDWRTIISNGGSDFVATHKTNASGGRITITNLTATADSSATTYTGQFTYSNMSTLYAQRCEADDGTGVSIQITTGSTNTFKITFSAYPVSQRKIYVLLGGQSDDGTIVESNNGTPFVLTQASSGPTGIRIYSDSSRTEEISEVVVDAQPSNFSYYVEYTNVDSGNPIFNSSTFTNVTNTGARILTTNNTMDDACYTITFCGTNRSTGEFIYRELLVTQEGVECNPVLSISSKQSLLVDGNYVVSIAGGVYPFYVNSVDVEFSSLVAIISQPDSASVNFPNQTITFQPYDGEGGGDTPVRPTYTGRLENDVIYVPIGNQAERYYATISAVTQDDQSRLSGDTYIYDFEIDPYVAPPVENIVTVVVTGTSYCGDSIESNMITFVQSGSTEPGGDDDCDFTISIVENLTDPSVRVLLDYSGSIEDLRIPRIECRRYGDAIRMFAYASGYLHQTVVDTEDLREDITASIDLRPISEGELRVGVLNFSTQHTNHYESYNQEGNTINITVHPYIAANQYRQCRVSFIVDHDGEYEVNVPDTAIWRLERSFGENTDVCYTQFDLEDDTTFVQFTVSNATETYTFNVTIYRRDNG